MAADPISRPCYYDHGGNVRHRYRSSSSIPAHHANTPQPPAPHLQIDLLFYCLPLPHLSGATAYVRRPIFGSFVLLAGVPLSKQSGGSGISKHFFVSKLF